MPLRIKYTVNIKDAHIGEKDKSILSKLRERMIRKSRESRMSFPKYSRDMKQGQAWCVNITL